MTNKLEISRELACPFCGSNELKHVTDDGIHFTQCKSCEATGPTGFKHGEDDAVDWNTRAAPVVERQEPSNKCGRCGASTVEGCNYLGCHFLESGNGEPVPPLIQTLHANGDRIAMEATIAQQAQRIADLERGRGEPTRWRLVPAEPTDDMIKAGIDTPVADTGDNEVDQPQDYRNVYKAMINAVAEQPAPVAVLAEVEELLNDMLKDDDQTAHWFAQRIDACLDKVKELNQ